jgi:hypothetical protein
LDTANVSVTIQGERDALAITISNVQGTEDIPFTWPIAIDRIDTNGETVADVIVRGLPVGTKVNDQFGAIRSVGSNGAVSVSGLDLATLQYQLPRNFSGTIQATVDVVSSLGQNFTQSIARLIDITPVADIGEIFAAGGRTDFGRELAIPVSYEIEDADGSEIATLGILGVPQGMKITDGRNSYTSGNPSQWANLSGWNLANLRLVTMGGLPGDYSLNYRLTIIEGANGSSYILEESVDIVVDEVLPQITGGGPTQAQFVPSIATEVENANAQDKQLVDNLITEINSLPFSSMLKPEVADSMEIATLVFETDGEIAREFEWLLRSNRDEKTAMQEREAIEYVLTEQFSQTLENSINSGGLCTMEEFELIIQELQQITESEELLKNQSDLKVESQQQFSFQSSLIALWNLLRATIAPQESTPEADARNEIRVTQRTERKVE